MFTQPYLQPGEQFPTFPLGTPEFEQLVTDLHVPLQPDREVVPQLVAYARGYWLNRSAAALDPDQSKRFTEVGQYDLLERSGVIDEIEPRLHDYDYALVDGGTKRVYDYRLDWLDQQLKLGLTKDVTIFAGQRLRFTNDDSTGRLEDIAESLYPASTGWARDFLKKELAKNPNHRDPWKRSFASEQEIATLTLIHRYGDRLRHVRTLKRKDAKSEVSTIPNAPILAEEFDVDGVTMRVLYGKAIRRSYAGQEPYTPRPTARSCFSEWLSMARPDTDSSVLLVSHNPNIYRSWLDLMLGTVALNRPDLRVDAAGPAIESDRSYNYVLRAIGSIFINYHSHLYGNDGSHATQSNW